MLKPPNPHNHHFEINGMELFPRNYIQPAYNYVSVHITELLVLQMKQKINTLSLCVVGGLFKLHLC